MDRPDPTSSGGAPGGRQIVFGRAIIVIVVAIVLGVLILRSNGGPSAAVPPTTTTTTVPRTTTTTTTVPHSRVKVLVLNDSTTSNVAGGYTTVLQHIGWSMLIPNDAKPPPKPTSAVYYTPNHQASADEIAAELGLPRSAVQLLTSSAPVPNADGANVVLVVGSDLASRTPPNTVPPPATTTTHPATTTTAKSHTSSSS
ncbi:MAG: LytR C-terminal domain-containing protein [Acidimicrobiales bacterium]